MEHFVTSAHNVCVVAKLEHIFQFVASTTVASRLNCFAVSGVHFKGHFNVRSAVISMAVAMLAFFLVCFMIPPSDIRTDLFFDQKRRTARAFGQKEASLNAFLKKKLKLIVYLGLALQYEGDFQGLT